jgi:CRP/FNR family transcriptional regulator, cyclic AMP receptor protein
MIDTFWGNIFGRHVKKEQLIFDALRAVPLFNELSNRELRAVQRLVYVRHYTDRETVFSAGDPSLGMYIINVGAVRIIREIPGGQPKLIAELTAGDVFGEMGLIDDSPRSASAVAHGATETIGFFKPELLNMSSRQPQLGLRILLSVAKTLSARLRRTHQELDELLQKTEKEHDVVPNYLR